MFIGSVQCEVELSQSHPAFESLRFLLVEAEHEVEWEGPVVAVDTVGAQVGDMVVVALAPLGPSVDIPDDLPIEAAVVGVVGSITTPAEDEEEESEEGERPRPAPRERPERPERERAPRRGREPRGEEEPKKREPRRPEPRSQDDDEERGRGRGRGRRRRPGDESEEREPEAPKREPEAPKPEKERAKTEAPADRAPGRGRETKEAPPAPKDDLAIVWDIEDDGEASPASTRRTSSRRRRR